MKILEHFTRSQNGEITVYRLKDAEWNNFMSKLPVEFRQCYIEDSELITKSVRNAITSSKFLERYILPDEPTIKSGDFGEILSYFLVQEYADSKGITLLAPQKWQWKDDRNKAAPCSDAIFFHILDVKSPSATDKVISVESKMKATNQGDRIKVAVEGANKDKLSRLSKTLSWLEEKFARQGRIREKLVVQRFKDPATHGKFEKHYKAIAILDQNFEAAELAKPLPKYDGIKILVFSIKDLQKAYEQTRINILKSV